MESKEIESLKLLEYVLENIKEHIEEIEWKKKNKHQLSYTDKILMYTELDTLMKIEMYCNEEIKKVIE